MGRSGGGAGAPPKNNFQILIPQIAFIYRGSGGFGRGAGVRDRMPGENNDNPAIFMEKKALWWQPAWFLHTSRAKKLRENHPTHLGPLCVPIPSRDSAENLLRN